MLSLKGIWEGMNAARGRDFLVLGETRLSYRALCNLVRGALAGFDANGLAPGDRVIILTTNETAAITAFTACLLDGLVPVLLTPETPAGRMVGIAASVEPALILADAARASEGWARGGTLISPEASAPRTSALLPGTPPGAGREPRLPEEMRETAYLLFTSGTTGAPTGVVISRANLLANLATLSRLFGYEAQSRIFNDMILAHGDGLVQGPLLALANACTLIRTGGFTVPGIEAWLDSVRRHRASHVITVPTVWAMIERYALHDDYFDAPECRALLSVAARLDTALWQRLEARFKRPVFNQYGLTETVASALYAGAHPEMGGIGTLGRPVDCAARIDLAGATHRQGGDAQEGELQLRGANVFARYWNDPARTAATFTEDGWMKTGDLVRRCEDGSFKMLGRLKSVIMSGGTLIRPEEIDDIVSAHPQVRECATVALPDATFEEIAVTGVVLDGDANEADLVAHARHGLEERKLPKRIVALAEIPRGASGKPQLAQLRDALRAALARDHPDASPGTAADTTSTQVMALAAEVFRVAVEVLDRRSTPETVKGWDSFSQISLVMAAEDRFGIRIPASRVAGMRSLADLIDTVQAGGA